MKSNRPKIFQARNVLASFEAMLANIAENAVYPEASVRLVELFHALLNAARRALALTEEKFRQDLGRYSSIVEKKRELGFESSDLQQRDLQIRLLEMELEMAKSQLRSANKDIDHIINYFQELSALLRYIESSAVAEVPLSLTNYLARIAPIDQSRHYVFVRRQWKPNFKYGEFIAQISRRKNAPRQLRRIFSEVNFSIAMVSVPNLTQENYLLACLVAHEVGHHYDFLRPLKEEHRGPANMPERELRSVNELVFRWEHELIADVYASLLIGPAYMFALLEFEGTRHGIDDYFTNLEEVGFGSYPSLRMRLAFIVATLNYGEVQVLERIRTLVAETGNECLTSAMQRLDELEDMTGDELFFERAHRPQLSLEGSQAETAWEILKQRKQLVVDHAFNHLTRDGAHLENACTQTKFKAEIILQALRKLGLSIPINESMPERTSPEEAEKSLYKTDPLDIGLILNIGWFRFLWLQDQYFSPSAATKSSEGLYDAASQTVRLVGLSVASSSFHKTFEELKDIMEE